MILDHLGDAYLSVGKTAQAVQSWRRAVKHLEKQEDKEHLNKVRAKLKKHGK